MFKKSLIRFLEKIGAVFYYTYQFFVSMARKIRGDKPKKKNPDLIKWFADKGDQTLRVTYPLHSDSEVWDVGGHLGDWAAEIVARYNCTVRVFEPVQNSLEILRNRFMHNSNVILYPYGLSGKSKNVEFKVMAESSTVFMEKQAGRWQDEKVEEVRLIAFLEVIKELGSNHIDLVKINIEGGEFELLEAIIDAGWVDKIDNIQVQFHDFVPNARERMMEIQKKLSFTHELTYQYDFVWENWKRIED
ncbi:MAG: FkbM family methyltransferase [Bacteroidota bacterium]